MSIFGMVSTRHSRAYTGHALRSFFQHTPLAEGDRFFLIDNDGSYSAEEAQAHAQAAAQLTFVRNPQPRSFAANANHVMQLAAADRADLFFLNNDLIFTPGWLAPLLGPEAAVVSPVSNRETQYTVGGGYQFGNPLELSDYLEHLPEFAELLKMHSQRKPSYVEVLTLPFYCIKIPYSVYSHVGMFDESFGVGGAEDTDYCLRCRLAGYRTIHAFAAYVLHFNGKSTFSGAENAEESRLRCARFTQRFEAKWGARLTTLAIGYDMSVLAHGDLQQLAQQRRFRELIQRLGELDGIRVDEHAEATRGDGAR